MAHPLGTLGKVINLSAQYERGSYQVDVQFSMYGLTFRAQRFVRVDEIITARGSELRQVVNSVSLFIVPPAGSYADGWVGDEYLKDISSPTCAVGRRALHLLEVASATSHEGIDERFAKIEMS